MSTPQKLPDIPSDINLFEIPRKRAPLAETAPPPPPSQVNPGSAGIHSGSAGGHQGGGHLGASGHPGANVHQIGQGYPGGGGVKPDPQMKYWEQKVKEYAAENLKLHQQLDAITKHRDQLLTVLSSQQQGGAELEEARAALEAETVNARQLEQQLAHLQQRILEFNGKFAERDQEIAVVRQRAAALDHQLTQSTADLARLSSELETQAAEHATLMSELRGELTQARESTERAEGALREQTTRARDASADLANLRLAHHDLQRQWEENRKSFADLNKRNNELEQRLADRAGEAQHLRAELDRRGTSYTDEFALRTRLKEELRLEHNARLAAEQEAATTLRRQNLEVQERLNEALKELDAVKRRSIEFTSNETTLAKQLSATQALADKAQSSYGKEAARANRLEKTLETLRSSKEELQEKLSEERKETTKFRRKAESLEKRLTKKRGGDIPTSGEFADIDLRVRDSVSALAKATADLENERRRLESAAMQSRLGSLDATRVGHAFVNSLRNQLRPSADSLMQSIRSLLDCSLESEQKKLAEAALENALVIQASLQQTAALQTETDS